MNNPEQHIACSAEDPEQRSPTHELEAPGRQSDQQIRPQPQHRSPAAHAAFWQFLLAVLRSFPRRRMPALMQLSQVECGAACLAMILSYYGRKTSVSEIREFCGIGRDGVSALHLVEAARHYGLRVKAFCLPDSDLQGVKLPAIVHWERHHFLVVERWSPRSVVVVDPAVGRRRVSAEEFEEAFTGVVILLEPGGQFDRRSSASPVTLRSALVNCLKLAPLLVVQIVAATLLLELLGLGVPILTKVVVDEIIPYHLDTFLPLLAVGAILFVLSQLMLLLLRAVLLISLQARLDTHVLLTSFEHLLRLPLPFFLRHASGDLLSRLDSATTLFDMLSSQLLSTILDGSFVLVYLFLLFYQSFTFGCLVLAIGLLQVLLLLTTAGPMRTLSSRELETLGKSESYEMEVLMGIATLKAAGAERQVMKQWTNLFFKHLDSSVRRETLASVIQTLLTSLNGLAPLLLLGIGALQVINHMMSAGTMLALTALAGILLAPLASLVSAGQEFQAVRAHLERLTEIMKAEPEQKSGQMQQPPRLTGQITLEGVSFQYDPHAAKALSTLTVSIQAGQKVAIVGPTGAGKSTLGELLLGLFLPTEGTIFYDGIPLRCLDYQAVRAQWGVVMQEASIFSGSIRQNICLHDPEIGREQMIKAAQIAALHEDIMQMPMGYETFVSEGGHALSGGQRQRLALARALARTPAILLLDEATSALDVITEHKVQQNLKTLACTQIIIAHRLSTIRHADLILVLEQGRLVESGSHEGLLAKKGCYARLIRSQVAREGQGFMATFGESVRVL